ncbi:MAG: M13 family metallopeptidase [Bacilli bacterium]
MNKEKEIRIQDDLYQHVNGAWLNEAKIPDDRPTTGGFANLDKDVEELLIKDFKSMLQKDEYPDENVKKAVNLFAIACDIKKRNKEGIRPLKKTLRKIEKLKNPRALNKNLKDFVLDDLPLPFNISVDADMKDTLHHCVMISGPSTILPDTTYYKPEMAKQKESLIAVWSEMVSQLLAFTPLSLEDQNVFLKDALAFDELIAGLVKSSEEWADYVKVYNPMKTVRVASLLKPMKFKNLLEDLFTDVPENIIVADPRFLKGFKSLYNVETFDLYKHWAYVKTLLAASPLLSSKLREISSVYRRTLSGIAANPTIEKQAYRLASENFSEPIGLYYGKTYFGEEAKKDVVEMVKEIIETYKKRIVANDFLAPATKDKAVLKLSTMVVKMGYPDKSDEIYDKLEVDPYGSLLDVVSQITKAKIENSFAKLYKPVNRGQWVMPGHMVNACYNPYTNDITFPAAILQAPFYSIKQSRSENLGGIGAVVGHEISHAFDNNGAQCDENGNLNNWWTKDDLKNFKVKTKAMIKQWDGLDEQGIGKVNGTLVVSENIADNGGMAVTLDIMSHMKEADYTAYFINWAKVWCRKSKAEYVKLLLSIDVHSPADLRANIQPRNFSEWYETFKVKPSDKMYIAPKKRVVIW